MADRQRCEDLLRTLIEASAEARFTGFIAEEADAAAIRDLVRPLASVEDLAVDWLSTNVDRVDVGLTGDGREWRVVYLVNTDDRVTAMWVYEKPPFFAGVAGGRAVVLNGPSGAGKSSLMSELVEQATTPWVMFDELWLGTLKQQYLIWHDAAPVVRSGFVNGIAALAATGNQVIFSAGGLSLPVVRDAFVNIPTLYVGLECPIDVLLNRERGRSGRWGGLAEASLGVHEGWIYDMRFDTSAAPAAELARRVLEAVHRRSAPSEESTR